MRYIYSLLMILITPFIILRLWWKGRISRLAERFSLTQAYPVDIWIHAVSLGEVVAVTPLIQAFLDKNQRVLVTTMTPTGSQRVQDQFGIKVEHQYIPYDLPWVLPRFFKQIKPQFGLIMETELWPNMIHYANAAKISLYLINARLSDRSMRQYQHFVFFFKPFLKQFKKICAQSEVDKQRFLALGADNVEVLGNIKFDVPINQIDIHTYLIVKKQWGTARVAFIAASTHADEEAMILSQLKKLQQTIPNVILLIAPRHPERFKDVYSLSSSQFKTGLRSDPKTLSVENEVIVIDSLGELNGFFAVSDYAFIGGSLVSIGGHNVLEPIAAKIPVFCGLYMQNSKSICLELQKAGGLIMVSSAYELMNAIIQLHSNEVLKKDMIENASRILAKNQGAVSRYLDILK